MNNYNQTRDQVIERMKSCAQNSTQSVWDHGVSVREHYLILTDHIKNLTPIENWWRVPQWVLDPNLLNFLEPDFIMQEYQIFHDCGKPYCCVIDENGRHFPDHAKVSQQVFENIGGNKIASKLILHDMDAHLLKGDGVEAFAQNRLCISLLITALAEVHSNAKMFGGVNSDSFKIKAKHLDKKGKQVIACLEKNKNLLSNFTL